MLGGASDGPSYGTVAGGVLVAAAEECDSSTPGMVDAGSGLPCKGGVGTTRSFTALQTIKG